ncbi:MAG: cysteine synthase A [Clostridia bacterium]|nr:cysteine synthase A [Clostridia bacterium]
MRVYNKVDELIGKTPLLRANNFEKSEGLKAKILLKLEYLNPAGSVKDRVALYMLNEAEKKGLIKQGGTVVEPTSGNTGIGLCAISASRGYKAVIVMPNSMSIERIKLMKAYGAEVVLTDGKLGMKGAIEKAEEINKNTPNSIIAGQFYNPANPLAHYKTTAPEIYEDTDGKVDIFIAGVGTGGTITGTGKYLKEKNKAIKVIGVEPLSSPLITKGVSGSHKIQGIGANFIPENYDKSVVDEVIAVSDEDSYEYARKIAKTEGVLVGISSGAAIAVGVALAKKKENENKNIVILLPDTGDRYLSTDLYE